MADSISNKNPLGSSLKASFESIKPFKYPLIYLSFSVMTILHIGFYRMSSVTSYDYYNKIQSMDFSNLFSKAENYKELSFIGYILEVQIFYYILMGFFVQLFYGPSLQTIALMITSLIKKAYDTL